MLNIKNLESYTNKIQTNPLNVIREYCQHLFLSYLYQVKGSERLLFKGGTALRIIFHSPRFSEDLDFTGFNITQNEIEIIFTDTLAELEKIGLPISLNTSKETTGGYIGNASLTIEDTKVEVHIEVSLRRGKPIIGQQTLIANDYIAPYTLVHLPQEFIVQGKLDALLARKKPRDFYDLYFLIRSHLLSPKQKQLLPQTLETLLASRLVFGRELKEFLPKSHWLIIRNFSNLLEAEIKKFL